MGKSENKNQHCMPLKYYFSFQGLLKWIHLVALSLLKRAFLAGCIAVKE
jgi:cytochrome c oxidase subunit IV